MACYYCYGTCEAYCAQACTGSCTTTSANNCDTQFSGSCSDACSTSCSNAGTYDIQVLGYNTADPNHVKANSLSSGIYSITVVEPPLPIVVTAVSATDNSISWQVDNADGKVFKLNLSSELFGTEYGSRTINGNSDPFTISGLSANTSYIGIVDNNESNSDTLSTLAISQSDYDDDIQALVEASGTDQANPQLILKSRTQAMLILMKFDLGSAGVDGKPGDKTKKAIRQFMEWKKLDYYLDANSNDVIDDADDDYVTQATTNLIYDSLTIGVEYSDITASLRQRLQIQMPLMHSGAFKINSPFDWRYIGRNDFHIGVDIDTVQDGVYPNIKPILPGEIVNVPGNVFRGSDGSVHVESTIEGTNMKIVTGYIHMKDIPESLAVGSEVTLDTLLGTMWYTGLTVEEGETPPYHLHLDMEITEGGITRKVDPEVYLEYFD